MLKEILEKDERSEYAKKLQKTIKQMKKKLDEFETEFTKYANQRGGSNGEWLDDMTAEINYTEGEIVKLMRKAGDFAYKCL